MFVVICCYVEVTIITCYFNIFDSYSTLGKKTILIDRKKDFTDIFILTTEASGSKTLCLPSILAGQHIRLFDYI